MPAIKMDRNVIIRAGSAPGGSVDIGVDESGGVLLALSHEGVRASLFLDANEAFAFGVSLIRAGEVLMQKQAQRAAVKDAVIRANGVGQG